VSEGNGTRVTAEDLDDGEPVVRVIKDDYNLVTDVDCEVTGIQVYPGTGTHVITVRNVGGKRLGRLRQGPGGLPGAGHYRGALKRGNRGAAAGGTVNHAGVGGPAFDDRRAVRTEVFAVRRRAAGGAPGVFDGLPA
jgi:secreted PhoX family phosphatase